ncbi:MAG: hypothetical protein IH794_09525 [Acidobacteria bacterium]|nr:hypothetical protein [Acidobacteriota bacterium]
MKIKSAYLALWIGLMTMGWVQAQLMSGESLVKIQTCFRWTPYTRGAAFKSR